jgi:hypothetical protein
MSELSTLLQNLIATGVIALLFTVAYLITARAGQRFVRRTAQHGEP